MSESSDKRDPIRIAGEIARTPPPKRFYKQATIGRHQDGFVLLLDGRVAKTPAGKPLAVSSEALATALVGEWAVQGERLDPKAMPLTRLLNSALDGVSERMAPVRADIVRHAGSDLVCYRADEPAGLAAEQAAHWQPLLDYAREALGAHFIATQGVIHVAQDRAALAAIERALEEYDALALAAVHAVTTLTGSAIIALAVARGALAPEAAWRAAHVDEDWQMSQWGRDDTALERRALRWREMEAAAVVLDCSRE